MQDPHAAPAARCDAANSVCQPDSSSGQRCIPSEECLCCFLDPDGSFGAGWPLRSCLLYDGPSEERTYFQLRLRLTPWIVDLRYTLLIWNVSFWYYWKLFSPLFVCLLFFFYLNGTQIIVYHVLSGIMPLSFWAINRNYSCADKPQKSHFHTSVF